MYVRETSGGRTADVRHAYGGRTRKSGAVERRLQVQGQQGQDDDRDRYGARGEGEPPAGAADPEPRRGRPRSAAAERAILDAVIALLEAGEPLAGLSIERIARTAGVGKATIYRRWSGKEELFVDVVRDMEPTDPPVSGTAGLADLRVMLESLRTRGLAQRSSVLLVNIFAQMKSHPKLWEEYHGTVIAPRRVAMLEAVRRAVAAGELRDDLDVELIDDLFVGPMLVRTVHRPDASLPDDLADRIITALLQGLAPTARA
ncbi:MULTISPECIES: TetR/AcrR family transcriptional regulator [Streptomyces]|uniref:TetR/AcrR family transcriptional regulator n=2 Tax=Streptomyces TaxID=1883 RepID=UPI000AE24680|nr:TetR/AcrR family transcriptional regulator [Streptomyces sp. WY228]